MPLKPEVSLVAGDSTPTWQDDGHMLLCLDILLFTKYLFELGTKRLCTGYLIFNTEKKMIYLFGCTWSLLPHVGLSCSMQTLSCCMWDLAAPLTRDGTRAPAFVSTSLVT